MPYKNENTKTGSSLLLNICLQIDDLRLSLSRAEKEYGRREDMLRQEISDLQLVWKRMSCINLAMVVDQSWDFVTLMRTKFI